MLAVITGAGSGIGRASVAKMLIRDYVVVAWVKNMLGEVSLLETLARKGIRVHKLYIVRADFCDIAQVESAITETKNICEEVNQSIDVFINCAGIYSQINFKAKGGTDIHFLVNFQVPVKLLSAFEGLLKKSHKGRAVFLFPNINCQSRIIGKSNYTNFKKSYINSKCCLAFYLESLARAGQSYNIYLYLPKTSTTDFFIKETIGAELFWGQVKKMFSLPPEYSAEQIVTIATRPEFADETGGIYHDMKLIPQPRFMFAKGINEKVNCFAFI